MPSLMMHQTILLLYISKHCGVIAIASVIIKVLPSKYVHQAGTALS